MHSAGIQEDQTRVMELVCSQGRRRTGPARTWKSLPSCWFGQEQESGEAETAPKPLCSFRDVTRLGALGRAWMRLSWQKQAGLGRNKDHMDT